MSMLNQSFVTDDAEDMSFDPLPVGAYIAKIKAAEIKTTASGTGEYISCQWEIMEALDAEDQKSVGRLIFQNLNIVNDNEMAVKIAKSQLKQICKAMGIAELADTNELVGQPVKIVLKIRPAKGGYDASNDVAKVMSMDSGNTDGNAPWEE